MDDSFLKGKRFLITQPMIHGFNGSTMATFELATYLLSRGASVHVYSFVLKEPAKHLFLSNDIQIYLPEVADKMRLKDYDYIWVHSEILPAWILEDLTKKHTSGPHFIFLHMSPLESIPDEHPWVYGLEKQLSNLSLYIAESTLESNEKYEKVANTAFYRNPAPINYSIFAGKPRQELKKVLVVSNHPPAEILSLRDELQKKDIIIDFFGEKQDNYHQITPDVLEKYDAVITIGKTVQYCLVNNTPVFIYDHYGGPGWLTEKNYTAAKEKNFTGRCSKKMTTAQILDRLLNDFKKTVDFQDKNLAAFQDEYLINKVIPRVLNQLPKKSIPPVLSREYVESAKSAMWVAGVCFGANEELGELRVSLADTKNLLSIKEAELASCQEKLNAKSYKFYQKILSPYTKLKNRKKN